MLRKLLWWSSGADLTILNQSTSRDKQRYSSIGATVVMSSILSTFSAYYAFYLVTQNQISSIILACMWGILITSLNRLSFTSFRSSDSQFPRAILLIMPRVLIGLFISLTISFPIQLKIFETSINEEIFKENQYLINQADKAYSDKIAEKNKERTNLIEQLDKELSGTGPSGKLGLGPVAQYMRKNINIIDTAINQLNYELQKRNNEINTRSIGLLERIDALSNIKRNNASAYWAGILITILFFVLELGPLILKQLASKGAYEALVEQSELRLPPTSKNEDELSSSDLQGNEAAKSNFENYCTKTINELQFQIDKTRIKATELLRSGIIIIISGILGYIGVVYFLMGVFLEKHEFKPYYIYFMISLSLLFIFVQFLGGWFLKQYRQTLNSSFYLNILKRNIDKYLLSYFAICEFVNEAERKDMAKELLLIIAGEFKNLDSQMLTIQEENLAKETLSSINLLKDAIANLGNKLK